MAEAPEVAPEPTGQQSRAKILEGVDFIETEEDAEAVESAVVKIQSTFRGKKIRSKLGQKQQEPAKQQANSDEQTNRKESDEKNNNNSSTTTDSASKSSSSEDKEQEALNKEVASMQVNDNSGARAAAQQPLDNSKKATNAAGEDEAERAATKIQAGFKGYKTRKELEGKLAGQQVAPEPQHQPCEAE